MRWRGRPRTFAQFSGAVGGGALAWWTAAVRRCVKCSSSFRWPARVAAGALNAAAGFAVTVAIGEAACVWLGYQRRGMTAPTDEVRRAFAEGLAAGLRQAKKQTAQPEQRA